MLRYPRVLLLGALLSACSGEPAQEVLHAIPLSGPDSPTNERGVGVVFSAGERGAETRQADTLLVFAEPEAGAPVVSRLVRDVGGVYALEGGTEALQGAAVAFAYEDVGLPLLGTLGGAAPDEWLHVLYALTGTGEPLEGWVPNDPSRVETLRWAIHLREQPLFFLAPDSIAFHETPNGPRVELTLAPGDAQQPFDYIMHPLTTQGPWMRVEVVSPSNYCFDPPTPMRDSVWVRYLDDGGEPRVWYYTRGC